MKNNIPVINSFRNLTPAERGEEPVDLWGLLRGIKQEAPRPQKSEPSSEDFREGEFTTSANIKLLG